MEWLPIRPVWFIASISQSKPFAAPLSRTSTISRRSSPARAREMRGAPTIVKIVDGHLRGSHDAPPYQDAGSRQPAITVVVERPAVANLDWLTIESAQLPTTASVDHQGCVERLTQIGSVAHRQEPLQIDVNELAPRSQRERATTERVGDPDEGLLHIEPVLINRRAHGLARRICTLDLREDLDVLPEPKVGVRLQSAEQPLSLVRWRRAEKLAAVALDASPRVEPQRQIRSRIIVRKRNVFEVVEAFSLDPRVGERRPVFLPSVGQDRRPLGHDRRRGDLPHHRGGRCVNAARGDQQGCREFTSWRPV